MKHEPPAELGARARTHIVRVRDFALKEIVAVVALMVTAAALFTFLSIADEVMEGETQAVDDLILQSLREPGQPSDAIGPDWLHVAATDVTALGSVTALALVVLIVAGVFAALRRFREAGVLIAAPATALLANRIMKTLFDRDRPDLAYRAAEALNPSFPSGHAMLSAVVYLTLGVLVARFTERRWVKLYALAAAILITLLVGLSRVYLGVHWASDVLAGWCIGAAWAFMWWLLVWLVERRTGPI